MAVLDLFKRRNRPTSPPQMTREQGQRAAIKLQQLIEGLGCFHAQVMALGQDLAIRVADGTISEADLSEALNIMHSAHDDQERACKQVSKAREMLAPAPVVHQEH